jgi:HAD superfamily hydrolase (TIGR01509 family)
MTRSTPAGVLFDVDGTLVDTTYLHAVSWWQALRQHDHDVPMADIHRAIGMGSDKILDHLLGDDRSHDDDPQLVAAHAALQAVYWDRLRPLPSAANLLHACKQLGLRVALASSASGRELEALRAAIDADDAIDASANADDADESKPAPDILESALAACGISAENAVFVGDSVWDVYAAEKLNIPCIGLTCGGTSEAELRDAGAIEVYADPATLLAALDRSILTSRSPDGLIRGRGE